MNWFSGSVVEAVTLSKAKNAIFVVYVEGEDQHSKDMKTMLEDHNVISRLESESFVSIKLQSGSSDYMQFARIYQIVPVPSIFFIGKNGTPLEVIGSGLDVARLVEKIDNVLKTPIDTFAMASTSAGPSTSNASATVSSQNLIANEIAQQQAYVSDTTKTGKETEPSTSQTETQDFAGDNVYKGSVSPPKRQKSEEYEVVCEGDVCIRKPKEPTPEDEPAKDIEKPAEESKPILPSLSTEAPASPQISLDERLKKAQDLIDQKRKEKEEKEKEAEKAKEADRRQMGKGVAELKRWQEEQEMKAIQEERRREKQENEKARARILEQIAQDRAERRSRDPTSTAPNTTPKAAVTVSPSSTPSGVTEVRIQFKLGDGSSTAAKFAPETTLSEVRNYVVTSMQITPPFALWTMFPRRAFTADEDSLDLTSLGLVPTAVLLVVSEGPTSSSGSSGGTPAVTGTFANLYNVFIQLFWSLFVSPVQFAWSWVSGNSRRGAEKRRADGQPSRFGSDASSNRPGTSRRTGDNIRRLRGGTPPPDDNNTWNGNSTQQM